MADVKIIDIDNEQWNIKDQDARTRITNLEENVSTQDLQDAQITMKDGYTCKSIQIFNHYKAGKIHFALIRIEDLSGNGVGTTGTIYIASTNLIPKKYTIFIARDYRAPETVRCSLETDGSISIGESNGISNGNNVIVGEIIFAEP